MNNFVVRTITAIFFAIVVVSCLVINQWTYLALIFTIMVGSVLEFYKISHPMFKKDKQRSELYRNLILSMSILAFFIAFLVGFKYISVTFLFIIPVFIAVLFNIELFLKSVNPFRNIGLNLLALYYIVLPLSLIHFVGFTKGVFTGAIVLGILFIIWANDSGAYIVGSLIGRNKLIPHVSPNKTIEGFLGGGLFCFLVAYLNIHFFSKIEILSTFQLINATTWYAIAGVVFIFATMGDLVESLLKRSLKIKDSGNILPGHGGFLDRFDAFLFVLPFIVAIVKILN